MFPMTPKGVKLGQIYKLDQSPGLEVNIVLSAKRTKIENDQFSKSVRQNDRQKSRALQLKVYNATDVDRER